MTVFLTVFTLFNLFAGMAAFGAGVRLLTSEGREGWASRRLYVIALVMSWGMGVLAIGATGLAWASQEEGHGTYVLAVLAPLAWLVLMGLVFAIVDFAEDGVFDFGRGPNRDKIKRP